MESAGGLKIVAVVAVVAIVILASSNSAAVAATDYVVGDYNGWRLNYDYQTWLAGKTFVVGDRLIFQYKKGTHDVIQVGALDYKNCAHPEFSTPLRSGYDIITLSTPGKKWFVCGFEGHCQLGMKFSVTVWRPNLVGAGAGAGVGGGAALSENISDGV